MIIGSPDTFGIEIGAVESYSGYAGLYVQFRFWIGNMPIGDWDDRISLIASVEYARMICANDKSRRVSPFARSMPAEVFQEVYDNYFSNDNYDHTKAPWVDPDYRDRFHMDGIGMGAIQDKYGIVLVDTSEGSERVIAKDLSQGLFIADVSVPLCFVESVLLDYIEWGKTQLPAG